MTIKRSFSKAYALAGARIGWAYAPPKIGGEMRNILNPNNVSIVSQEMARAAVLDQAYLTQLIADTSGLRDRFAKSCRDLGMNVPESRTNFVLIRFASPEAAGRADAALRAAGLMMRGMAGYGLPDCLRATVCEASVMDQALQVIEGVVT